MPTTDTVSFLLNGHRVDADGVPPTTTLLDYLRVTARLRGTKEGCAEGDCGACTVALSERVADGVRYRAVNSCLVMLGQIDSASVITVEGVAGADGSLHPLQRAMADLGASQCGYCTPGFVMALFALLENAKGLTTEMVHDALAGNLCRCTGYRPIVDAALAASSQMQAAPQLLRKVPAQHEVERDGEMRCVIGSAVFELPRTLDALLALKADRPDATLLAGGTDLGLVVSKRVRKLDDVIALRDVAELNALERSPDELVVGAAVTYDRLGPELAAIEPSLGRLVTRFGSPQIRNLGTLGGNIGTASPIGDMLPCLLALDAIIELASVRGTRTIAAREFFLGYRHTALAADEVIVRIRIPIPGDQARLRVYKLSKRYDQDISTVCGAFWLELAGDRITDARFAYGGMAATPARAIEAERAVVGERFDAATFDAASGAIARDFSPLADMRSSAAYRSMAAANLLSRLHLDLAGVTRDLDVMSL